MLTLSTDFPGTAAENLRVEDGRVRFRAPRGDAPVSMWWHFALEGGGSVACVWEQTDEVLGGGGLAAAVPVYHDGRRWRRVPARFCRYVPERHEFHFRVPCRAEPTEVAYCYPYPWERLERLLNELEDGGQVRVRELCRSERGRPFRLLEFGHGELEVWVTARHHAAEVSGAYALEGFVREALRRPKLLAAATFHVAPAMDTDGVAEGLYGKDRPPRDFNRDYVSAPTRPEVAALRQAAEQCGRVDVFLDLHAPAPGDETFVVPTKESYTTLDDWDRLWELGRYLEAFAPAGCPCRVADLHRDSLNWSSENTLQTATDYFHRRFGALALTLEVTYHRAWDGRLVSDRGWLGLGKALARAVAVRAGACRAPEVSAIAKPVSLLPRFRDWWCVHVPREVQFSESPGALEITGDGLGSTCWLMGKQVLKAAALTYRLAGSVTRCTVTAKGWDSEGDLPTGTWTDGTVALRPGTRWRTQSLSHDEGACLPMVRIEGLTGKLELRSPSEA